MFQKGNQINKGRKVSEETKEKLRKSAIGNKYAIGSKHTEEWKKQKSESMKGKNYFGIKPPWNKGLKGVQQAWNKGLKQGHPWNYIDGRSKNVGPARYGDDWDKIRGLVYHRDCFKCQECGVIGKSKRALDIHHIVPFLISYDNSLNNLITLCRKCHMKIERNLIKEQKKVMESD